VAHVDEKFSLVGHQHGIDEVDHSVADSMSGLMTRARLIVTPSSVASSQTLPAGQFYALRPALLKELPGEPGICSYEAARLRTQQREMLASIDLDLQLPFCYIQAVCAKG